MEEREPKLGVADDSKVYVINIESFSNEEILDFDILCPYQYINNSSFDENEILNINLVKISSGTPNITYKNILNDFIDINLYTEKIIIFSKSKNGKDKQVLQNLKFINSDANGNLFQKIEVPYFENDKEENEININYNFKLNGFSKIKISKILPKASLKMYIYVTEKQNKTKRLDVQHFLDSI
jgi:hypothetical protein